LEQISRLKFKPDTCHEQGSADVIQNEKSPANRAFYASQGD
jgi:hypothetical protein